MNNFMAPIFPTNIIQPLPTNTIQPFPTNIIQPLPTNIIQPLPANTIQPLPTNIIQSLPTNTIQPLPANTIQPLGSCTNPVVIEDVEDTTSYIIISDDEVDDPENSDMEIESENEATQLPLLWDQSRSVPSERGLQEANSNVLKYFPVENNFVGEASSGKGKSVRFLLPVQENDVLSDRVTHNRSFPEVCTNLRTTKIRPIGHSESMKEAC